MFAHLNIKQMKKIYLSILALTLSVGAMAQNILQVDPVGRFVLGEFSLDGGVLEITAYHAPSKRLYSINGLDNQVIVIDLTNPSAPAQLTSSTIDISTYGASPNSIAVYGDILAVAVEATVKQDAGSVVFFNATNGTYLNDLEVGALPDMLTFTPNGQKVVVCNEGEPNLDYNNDPEGTISIIDISTGVANASVASLDFNAYDSRIAVLNADGIRIAGLNSSVSQDMEPEYAVVSNDSKTAWVVCQENNAIVIVDIENEEILDIRPLGFKDHSIEGNGLDASDRFGASPSNAINITTWPIRGLFMPDGMSTMRYMNRTYILTANEGDARDYAAGSSGFIDEQRIGSASITLDAGVFPNASTLKQTANLGRLNMINTNGDLDDDGDFDIIYTYGARSFSIWDSTITRVYDSGDEFEQYLADAYPTNFNANHNGPNNQMGNRSDNKGPEPEAVVTAVIGDSTYAFIGLERQSGIMVYNVTNPFEPYFIDYVTTRNFAENPVNSTGTGTPTGGDLGPEGLLIIPKTSSPGSKALLIVSYEVSGTVGVYEITEPAPLTTSIFGAASIDGWYAYPNPANGETITMSRAAQVNVYSAVGELVMSTSSSVEQLNVSGLAKGVYIIRNTEGETIKFVKE